VKYEKSIEKLLDKLQVLMKNEDGNLTGDKSSGDFYIKSKIGVFKGHYTVKNTMINIVIDKKPFFISKKVIEQEVKKYLQSN
jgi:hypothetical protein